MSELNLNITTPSKKIFSGEIKAITVPGTNGSFQVLRNHAPIISTLEIGVIKIDLPDGKSDYYAVGGGTIEVLNNNIVQLKEVMKLKLIVLTKH